MPKVRAGYFFRTNPRNRSQIRQFLFLTSDHLKTRLSAIGTGRPFGLQRKDLQKNLVDGVQMNSRRGAK